MSANNMKNDVMAIFKGWQQNKEQKKLLSEEMKDAVERAAEVMQKDKKLVAKLFRYLEKEETIDSLHDLVETLEEFKKS